MPSFDIVSEVDRQELRNAVDQAQREMSQRFDFKGTNSSIEQNDLVITIKTISEEKARAVRVLLEEKFVKRGMSLKGIDWGKFEQASGDTVRQVVTIKVGITSEKATMNPPAIAPSGLPKPPTIAAAKIGSSN